MIGRLMSLTLLTLIRDPHDLRYAQGPVAAVGGRDRTLLYPALSGSGVVTNLEVLDLERCEANNGHG